GKRLAAASIDGMVKVWDVITGQVILTFYSGCWDVAFSPDGRRLVTGFPDPPSAAARVRKTCVWDAATGRQLLALDRGTIRFSMGSFSPASRQLAGASGATVKVWDTTTGQELLALNGHTQGVLCVVFSPDGKHLASASADQTLRLWNATTGQPVRTLR